MHKFLNKKMDIFNKLKITYKVKITTEDEIRTYSIFIDGEDVLIRNPNFSKLHPNNQYQIVSDFIKYDRIRYKTKEFYNAEWIEDLN